MTFTSIRPLPLAAAMLLGACGEPVPGGQVLAIVNGEEVTERDLATEGGDADRQTALRQIVGRRLLAQAAREEGLELTPEYLAALRRTREQLLVQSLGRQLSGKLPDPTPDEVTAYIAAHPHAFSERVIAELKGSGGEGSITLDTARMGPGPGGQLATRKAGERFQYGGMALEIVAIRPAPLSGIDARAFAGQSLRAERLDAEVGKILAQRRAKASISYRN